MAAEELPGYGWLAKSLSGPILHRVKDVRTRVQPILDTNLLPHFTDHSIQHSDRVIAILGMLLDNNLAQKDKTPLDEKEIAVLAFAALLHDVGMQLPAAHGLTAEITSLSSQDLALIRKNHGKVAGEVLRELTEGKDPFQIGLGEEKYRKYLPLVAWICERHQSASQFNPGEVVALDGAKIRVGVLTAVLRLADQLDCDSRRVSMDRLRQYSIPVESVVHWLMCQYVDAVTIDDGFVKIAASYPDTMSGPLMEFLAMQIIEKLKGEFEPVKEILWDNNIKTSVPDKIRLTGVDFTYKKSPLPEEIVSELQGRLKDLVPQHLEIDTPTIIPGGTSAKETDVMGYWGFVGNPFLDRDTSYGSELFIETPQIATIVSETSRHLSGPHGDLRLVLGERGMGKTTLFNTIKARLGDQYSVHIIDVAQRVVNVRTASDLHQLILSGIGSTLQSEGAEPLPDRIVDIASRGKKKVICLDSLDRLPPERADFVNDFLKTAQRFLTDMRMVSVVFISCAKRWENFLFTSDLSYLGGRNQWDLQPFSTDNLVAMLDKRLRSSGKKYSDVFEPGCASALHAISGGNPRFILQHAESICRLAAQKGVAKVSSVFIHQSYKDVFDKSIQALLDQLAKESEGLKKGLTSLYLFLLEMERRNADTDEGWRCLLQLLDAGIEQKKVAPVLFVPLSYVAFLSKSLETGQSYYKPHAYVAEVFKELRKKGFEARDFIAFYSANPVRPVAEDDKLLLELKSPLLVGQDLEHLEKGRQLFLELTRIKKPPPQTITMAWDCLEEMLLANLIKHGNYNLGKLDTAKAAAFQTDRYGVERYRRGAGRVLADAAWGLVQDFSVMQKAKDYWMKSYNGMKWILGVRNNILRGSTLRHLDYGEKERDLCLRHLDQVFRELFQMYCK